MSVVDDYVAALRSVIGAHFPADTPVTVFHVAPGRQGLCVGFQVHAEAGSENLFYVEPAHSTLAELGLTPVSLPTGDQVMVWQYPADPELPALSSAVFPDACGALLARMGKPESVSHLSLVGYRPGRRAVVRVVTGSETLFLKVLRPDKSSDIVERYNQATVAGAPAPKIVGWSPAGVIVFQEASGISITDAITQGLTPQQLVDRVIDAGLMTSQMAVSAPARKPAVVSREWYFTQAENLLPHLRDRLQELRPIVDALVERGETGPETVIHGDLHPGQVFVHPHPPHTVTGIIDLDGVGAGFLVDDMAAFYAHSITTRILSQSSPGGAKFWAQVTSLLVDSSAIPLQQHPRLAAGTITHLVGHALNHAHRGTGEADSMVEASWEILEGLPGL